MLHPLENKVHDLFGEIGYFAILEGGVGVCEKGVENNISEVAREVFVACRAPRERAEKASDNELFRGGKVGEVLRIGLRAVFGHVFKSVPVDSRPFAHAFDEVAEGNLKVPEGEAFP